MDKSLDKRSLDIRLNILKIVKNSGEGHLGSSFSIVEALLGIYDWQIENKTFFDISNFILSKGHASYAYYAFLHEIGYFSTEELDSVGKVGSKFYGHLPHIPNDERFIFGSGSLGHGIPFAAGLALGNRLSINKERIICLVGDGEANEGTFWETLLLINKFGNLKITLLIDCNNSSERAIPITDTLKNLNIFENISLSEVDGHNVKEISDSIGSSNAEIILMNTIKGYPAQTMMGNPIWHHRTPNDEEFTKLTNEILNA